MKNKLHRVGVFACGLLLLVSPSLVSAQAGAGLQMKPAIIEDNVSLGGVTQYSVTVRNLGSERATYYLSAQDITGLDDEGKPLFAEEGQQTGYELSTWITFPVSQVTLDAGGTQTVPFSVHVPNRANPGGHFGAIFFTTEPQTVGGATGSAIGYSVGTIVSLQLPGDVRTEAELREFSTGKIIYSSPEVDFTSRIQNSGNVLIRPHGVIEVTDMFGRLVGSVEVNATGAPVFPGSLRKYPSSWTAEGFVFGRYQVLASFAYGTDEVKSLNATTSFWILPFKAISIVLGVLLGLILGMYIAIRLYIRNKLRDMGISSSSRDADYYARKYQKSGSRMIVVTLIVFLICVLFLAVLFLAFA